MNRYLVFLWQGFNTAAVVITTNSAEFCQRWGHSFLAAAGTTEIIIVHLILAIRVWSLYARSRLIGAFLLISLLGTAAGEIYVDLVLIPNFTRIVNGANTYACFPDGTKDTSLFFVPVLIFEVIVLILVIFQAVNRWRSEVQTGIGSSSLFTTLVRDSVGYFFVILVVYIVNAVTWVIFPTALKFLLQGYSLAAVSIMGTRLLLNLRLEAKRQANGTDSSIFELDSVKFAPRSKITERSI